MIYANTPPIPLSQPDAFHVALAAVRVDFGSESVDYPARLIPIDPAERRWLYVCIEADSLEVFAEPNHSKCGEPGYIYMGAIKPGGEDPALPGGWPAPKAIFARVS